jgi:hypothetical protein
LGPTPTSVHTSDVSCARDEGEGGQTWESDDPNRRIDASAESGVTKNWPRRASTGQHRATIVEPGGPTRADEETHRPGRKRHERERHGRERRRGEREPGCDAAPGRPELCRKLTTTPRCENPDPAFRPLDIAVGRTMGRDRQCAPWLRARPFPTAADALSFERSFLTRSQTGPSMVVVDYPRALRPSSRSPFAVSAFVSASSLAILSPASSASSTASPPPPRLVASPTPPPPRAPR